MTHRGNIYHAYPGGESITWPTTERKLLRLTLGKNCHYCFSLTAASLIEAINFMNRVNRPPPGRNDDTEMILRSPSDLHVSFLSFRGTSATEERYFFPFFIYNPNITHVQEPFGDTIELTQFCLTIPIV